jgi:predicted transcriptional regulator
MTVAARPKPQAPLRERLRELDDEIEQLVLAARQLQVEKRDVMDLLDKKWRGEDVPTSRQRERP